MPRTQNRSWAFFLALALTGCGTGEFHVARLVEIEVLGCEDLRPAVAERVSFWRAESERLRGKTLLRIGWEDSLEEMVDLERGVVLTVRVVSAADVSQKKWFGRAGSTHVGTWRSVGREEKTFLPARFSECEERVLELRGFFLASHMGRVETPPSHPADFLGLPALLPVSGVFYRHLPDAVQRADHLSRSSCDGCDEP